MGRKNHRILPRSSKLGSRPTVHRAGPRRRGTSASAWRLHRQTARRLCSSNASPTCASIHPQPIGTASGVSRRSRGERDLPYKCGEAAEGLCLSPRLLLRSPALQERTSTQSKGPIATAPSTQKVCQRASEKTQPRFGVTLGGVMRPQGTLVPRMRQAPDGCQEGGSQPTDISRINRRVLLAPTLPRDKREK